MPGPVPAHSGCRLAKAAPSRRRFSPVPERVRELWHRVHRSISRKRSLSAPWSALQGDCARPTVGNARRIPESPEFLRRYPTIRPVARITPMRSRSRPASPRPDQENRKAFQAGKVLFHRAQRCLASFLRVRIEIGLAQKLLVGLLEVLNECLLVGLRIVNEA